MYTHETISSSLIEDLVRMKLFLSSWIIPRTKAQFRTVQGSSIKTVEFWELKGKNYFFSLFTIHFVRRRPSGNPVQLYPQRKLSQRHYRPANRFTMWRHFEPVMTILKARSGASDQPPTCPGRISSHEWDRLRVLRLRIGHSPLRGWAEPSRSEGKVSKRRER